LLPAISPANKEKNGSKKIKEPPRIISNHQPIYCLLANQMRNKHFIKKTISSLKIDALNQKNYKKIRVIKKQKENKLPI
jgi:hypothetical protein